MVELLRYLEANGFTCYIVSGGDRDFMRPMTEDYYGIPPERVIGSALGLQLRRGVRARCATRAAFDFIDDGAEKPIRIWSRSADGRSSPPATRTATCRCCDTSRREAGSASRLLVHHDDDTGRGDAPYDQGAEKALAAASDRGYTVVSVQATTGRSVFVGHEPDQSRLRG